MYVSHGSCGGDEDRVEPKLVTFSIDQDLVVKVPPPGDSGDFYESTTNLTITMLMMTATRTNETGLVFCDMGTEEEEEDHEEEIRRRFWDRYRRGQPGRTQRICTTIRKLLERVREKRGGGGGGLGGYVDFESLVSLHFSVVVRVKVCRIVWEKVLLFGKL